MKDLYFITGFLGTGKTTFMHNLINEFKDNKLHVIINEFGKIGIDGKLLQTLGIALDEINNGSILCSCRMDKFADSLEEAVKGDAEIIIIESSGLTDPSNLVKVLNEFEFTDEINYKGCICLVDAKRFHKVYDMATVVTKQIYAADLIIINKCDLVDEIQIKKAKDIISKLRPDITTRETSFGNFQREWIEKISINNDEEDLKIMQVADITLKKYLIRVDNDMDRIMFEKFVKMFLDETYRTKGFMKFGDTIYYLDCVGNIFKMNEISPENIQQEQLNEIVVLAGKGLYTKTAIKEAIKLYPMAVVL